MTLTQVKKANPGWFSPANKRFFGDRDYQVKNTPAGSFLVRSTWAWSDMFGAPRKLRYRINPLSPEGNILPLLDEEFLTIQEVNDWLKENCGSAAKAPP